MKALTTQIAERKAWLIENHKCVVADFSPLTFYRENGELDEEKTLSAINKYSKSKGFQESVEIRESRRIERKNGTALNESVKEDRVQRAMRLHKMNFREATIFCGGRDPGKSAKQPAAFTESLAKAWDKYCGGLISEADCQTLAEKGISPE
jgi:hypothetical protein